MNWFHRRQRQHRGFLLLEVLLGISVFSLFMFAVGLVMISGQENSILGGDRIRSSYLAERSIEGVRSMRDTSFSSVATGQHGVTINAAGAWIFSGSLTVSTGSYTTWVYITSASTGLLVNARSMWQHGYQHSGSILISTELADWRSSRQVGNWSSVTVEGSVTEAGTPNFSNVYVTGNYALIAGDIAGGGNGLYVYDVSDLTNPVRVNPSLNVGYSVYQLAVRGKRLYMLTDDANGELKVYNIGSLPTVSLVTSYDLPGTARGRTLRAWGASLFVGATYSATPGEKEIHWFDISNSGSIVLRSTLDDTANIADLGLTGTSAYLASADDTGELRVVTVFSSGSMRFATGSNISGTEDGLAIALHGTSALLGRQRGTGIQELVMLRIPESGGPAAPSGPWYRETSGSVVGVTSDSTGCYAFAATRQKWKAFQVMKMNDASLTELASYTLSSNAGKHLFYSTVKDRIFFLSDNTLYIFKPGAGTGSC